MPDGSRGFRVIRYADAQRQGVDWNEVMSRGHTIHGLVEFDVTETRKAVHRYRRRARRPLSFTSVMVASFARAVAADTSVQAYRKGSGQLVLFDDVDCTVLVEHEMDGMLVPIHVQLVPHQVDGQLYVAAHVTQRDEPHPADA